MAGAAGRRHRDHTGGSRTGRCVGAGALGSRRSGGCIAAGEDLYARRERLIIAEEDTQALDSEILDVRRLLRKGPQLQPGELLLDGRFRLVGTLGQGGFATVFKAYDRQLKCLVAIKVLHAQHYEDRTRRERFFRGARKMAELNHPSIVRVLEAECEDDGWLFFVMELVAGGDFSQAVLAGKLSYDEILTIVSQVGEVLEFAHQQGVIHRDVKPANVLLDEARQPKLTDFDLVRVEDSTGFTQTRAMLGTLNYAAPEALESPQDAGPPADVYSLASMTIFALLGGPLPRGYYRKPDSAIASLSCPPALAQVLTQATAEDPEQRFPSAGAFVSAVKASMAPWSRDQGVEEVLRETEDEEGQRGLKKIEATVLFADIVGFTAFSENAAPEEVAELMEGYFTRAVGEISNTGGTLDKFIGDSVMAFFGSRRPRRSCGTRRRGRVEDLGRPGRVERRAASAR
jgi:tRNA A-37 threonylcarbamoyl transferase component Bud32